MQASDFMPLVAECCSDVLESMYFTTVLETSSCVGRRPEARAGDLAFSLRFRGDVHGTFGLIVGVPMARAVAANFLGEEEETLSGKEVAEVVGELTNMLCGSIVSRIEGTSKFALSHPEPFAGVLADLEILSSNLETDSGILQTWIALDPPFASLDRGVDEWMQAAR